MFIQLQRDSVGFQPLAQLLFQWTGITLPSGPTGWSLMASRLSPIFQRSGIKSYAQYISRIKSLPKGHPERELFVSAMSTHTTSFFRESVHFDTLRDAFRRAREPFRVWSAACSSGAEAYTMSMVLEDTRSTFGGEFKILATDLAEDVLERAQSGLISNAAAEEIPTRYRTRFWRPYPAAQALDGIRWSANESIRAPIHWAKFNLVHDQYPRAGAFDVIFCRNVLIYFNQETASAIIDRLMSCLKPRGLLVLGHADGGKMQSREAERLGSAVFSKQAAELRPCG